MKKYKIVKIEENKIISSTILPSNGFKSKLTLTCLSQNKENKIINFDYFGGNSEKHDHHFIDLFNSKLVNTDIIIINLEQLIDLILIHNEENDDFTLSYETWERFLKKE